MLLTTPAPTTAERIRSTCAHAGEALLALDNQEQKSPIAPLHHLLDDGSFAVAIPTDRRLDRHQAGTGSRALLELIDYAPLPVRDPVRSLVWVRGRLQEIPPHTISAVLDRIATKDPNPALLQVETPRSTSHRQETGYTLMRLEIASVVVSDLTGAELVSTAHLLEAEPDPFCEVESSVLWHLVTAHPDVVDRLIARLPAPLRRGRVHPLSLDRYGLRFRVEADDGDHDLRLPFHKPVEDMAGLRQAIRVLMGCPFGNGLRARR